MAVKYPAGEFGLALALRTRRRPSQILGFAFTRRTWANNFMLEFLAASPAAGHVIKGVGRALMQTLSRIALSLHCSEMWGECTELSQGFYVSLKETTGRASGRNQRPAEVRDRFQFTREELSLMVEGSQVRMEGCEPDSLDEP